MDPTISKLFLGAGLNWEKIARGRVEPDGLSLFLYLFIRSVGLLPVATLTRLPDILSEELRRQ